MASGAPKWSENLWARWVRDTFSTPLGDQSKRVQSATLTEVAPCARHVSLDSGRDARLSCEMSRAVHTLALAP
eukprot:2807203-Pyramimonas_sp.AAC.1